MSVIHDPGRYRVRVIDQRFIEQDKVKDTEAFALWFRPIVNLDRPEAPVKPTPRHVVLWFNEQSYWRNMERLRKLGYQGDTLDGIDPDNEEGFHDFRDAEMELFCEHEENINRGESFEKWLFERGGPAPMRNKGGLRKLDRAMHADREFAEKPQLVMRRSEPSANGGKGDGEKVPVGVTDSDVPF
jgi:hypothetical protein